MNRYLVCSTFDREEYFWHIRSSIEIFNSMDMADCSNEEIVRIYLLPENGDPPIECAFHGTWHNPKFPLKMVIESGGQVIDEGWGEDH